MAKGFKLILGTTDSTNVRVSDEVQVRADAPHFDPPQVGFAFPPHISPKQGEATGPYWSVSEYWAFAYCQVTPTPTVDGTGRFLVQYYYNSGNWPNDPARKFEQTFDGTATTINGTLHSYTLDELAVNAGGGDATLGFASQYDVSGLRHALIVTNADLSASSQAGARAGFRNPGTDDLIAAYRHVVAQNKLQTLTRLEHATGSPDWTAGAQIIAHPYHYVPLYMNNGAVDETVLPRVLVIEEGTQFPLTGLFNVSGTQVSGLYTRFLAEIASGSQTANSGNQMAIRFTGTSTWYMVSGVTSNSGLVLFDYGLNPQVISGTAEAVPFAIGSGVVTVGPGLEGCANWDIAISPDIHDGDSTPNLNNVALTAGPVALVPGAAPSGTLSYRWEVQRLGGPITTITNSGNSILVNFSGSISPSGTGTPVDVRVFASGTGQPTCVHSDSTGYIGLKKAISAGTFYAEGNPNVIYQSSTSLIVESKDTWRRVGTNYDPLFFHHQIYAYSPHRASLNGAWATYGNYMSVVKGQIDSWPTTGTFVVAYKQYTSTYRLIYGTYTGKQTGTTDDRLTGVAIVGSLLLDSNYGCSPTPGTSPGVTSVPKTYNSVDTVVYVPSIGTWPFTFVKSKTSSTSVIYENAMGFNQHSLGTNNGRTKIDVWFLKAGQAPEARTQVYGQGPAGQQAFTTPLPSWVDAGTLVVMAPWDSNLTGSQETLVSNSYWNRGNMGFMYVDSLAPAGQYVSQPVDTLNTNRIYVADVTSRLATGSMGSFPRYTWLPAKGRIVVPNYDRSKTMIFSYTNWVEFNNGHNNGTQGIYFDNCRLLGLNGSATSGNLMPFQFVAVYKEGKFESSPTISTKSGQTPETTVYGPGIGEGLLGYNSTLVDVVNATLTSGYSPTGTQGTPLSTPNWEGFLTNFPTNGIVGPDPIYRRPVPAGTAPPTTGGGGGGGCLASWTIVTIKHADGFAKEVPISEVAKGDMIASMDRTSYAMKWCEVLATRALEAEEAFEIITDHGFSILVTGQHPIATCNEKQWTTAEELEVGTWIETENGPDIVTKKEKVITSLTVYDLQVDDLHTFVAGGVLVHNKRVQNV